MTENGRPIVISQESVREEWNEMREMERRLKERAERFERLVGYLQAIDRADWIPEEAASHRGLTPGHEPVAKGTWISGIMAIIANAPEGISNTEVRKQLLSGPIADKMRNNPNGYYNAVSKLESRKEIVKYKGRLFTPTLLDGFMRRVDRGDVKDLTGFEDGKSVKQACLDFIEAHPQGSSSVQLIKAVTTGHGVGPNSVYNTLSKLVQSGQVKREGRIYFPLTK